METIAAAGDGGREIGEALAADGAGGEPAADPRPLSRSRSRSGCAGARARAALHGVARRQRRAARHRGRHRAAAAGGQLQDLRRVVGRRSSWRCGRRSRRRRPTSRAWRSRACPRSRAEIRRRAAADGVPAATPSWFDARRLRRSRLDGLAAAEVGGRAAGDRPTSRARCWPIATLRGLRRPARRRASSAAGALTLPRAAAAASSCRAPGARSTTTGCSSSPCRCCGRRGREGGAGAVNEPPGRRAIAAARARRRGRWARSGELAKPAPAPAPDDARRALRPVRPRHPGGPPPHARPRRAPDRVRRARAAGRCARATPSTGRSARARCGSRTSSCPTTSGRRSRSRSAWRSSCAAA